VWVAGEGGGVECEGVGGFSSGGVECEGGEVEWGWAEGAGKRVSVKLMEAGGLGGCWGGSANVYV
jgi:hypothetical protein